jgi:hypothetical protein
MGKPGIAIILTAMMNQFLFHCFSARHEQTENHSADSNPVCMKTSPSCGRICRIVALAMVWVLLLFCEGFCDEWEDPPGGRPEQMQSRVDYDSKLSDPFFESEAWSREDESERGQEGEPLLKHTARCFSTSFGSKHEVRYCEAKLVGVNAIDLRIHQPPPGFLDELVIRIRNGMFTCQFWTVYKAGPHEGLTWTTKRQKLTLVKKTYGKGDVIKGKIDIEVLDELINPKYPDRPPRLIKVYGVFKTIME